jgi:ankyrin repeat protein
MASHKAALGAALILALPILASQSWQASPAAAQPAAGTNTAAIQNARWSVMRVVAEGANGRTLNSGTGFVARSIATGQLIVTAYHVVAGAPRVRLSGGSFQLSVPATLAVSDRTADVAILFVSGQAIAHPLPLGDADGVAERDTVYVLGFPRPESLGETQATMTEGTVSAVLRPQRLIQMQAPISPGNSGGPVLNRRGEVVGIAASVLTGPNQEINFAGWINSARPLLDGLTASTHASPQSDRRAMALAAMRGDGKVCDRAAASAALNERDETGALPLVEAAYGPHLRIIQCLIAHGASVNAADALGMTPLLAVAQAPAGAWASVLEAARFLVNTGASANVRDAGGNTPVMWALVKGDEAVAAFLVTDAHANVNLRDKNLRTALMYAAVLGNSRMADLLASRGSAVNVHDAAGRTALNYAIQRGDLATIKVLVAHHADVAEPDQGGHTPAWYAARHLLAALNLDPGLAPSSDKASEALTLLNAAAHGELVKVRVFTACRAALVCDPAVTPDAAPASWVWYQSVMAVLQSRGAPAWSHAPGGVAPLMRAVWERRADAVRSLAANGTAVNDRDAEGWSPVMAAAWGGRADLVEVLVAAGGDGDVVNDLGRTPLMYAAAHGDLRMVRALVERSGADPVRTDFEARDAAWYAACWAPLPGRRAVLGYLHASETVCVRGR